MSFGSYVLGSRIAQGGMGEIFTAVRVGIGNFRKPVAIKLLLTHLAEEEHIVQMFLGEAFIAARMNHPNIVQVYDVGHEAGRYFMAMELVRGIAMWSFIGAMARRGQRLPASLICYIGRELCEGLHYAHELCDEQGQPLNVIHRDVTPANILLTEDGRAKVTDFGIAKARDVVTKTYPGTVKGTLEYLSPEQASGTRVDRRADIYCAGVTLFHLATYQSPFWKGNDLATINAIQNEPLPSLTRMRPDLPSALATALSKATHKDPNGRFASARDFRDAIPPPPPNEVCAEELARLVRDVLGPDRPVAPQVATPPAKAIGGDATVQMAKPTLAQDGDRITALVSSGDLPVSLETAVVPPKDRAAGEKEKKKKRSKSRDTGSRIRWAMFTFAAGVLVASGLVAAYRMLPGLRTSPSNAEVVQLEQVGDPLVKREQPAAEKKVPTLRTDDIPPPPVAGSVEPAKPVLPAEMEERANEADERLAEEERREKKGAEERREREERKGAEERRADRDRGDERRDRADRDDDRKPSRVGYLNVRSTRSAQVLINGKKIGETPLTRFPVAPGEVTVVVRAANGRTQKHTLRVVPGKAADLRAEFR